MRGPISILTCAVLVCAGLVAPARAEVAPAACTLNVTSAARDQPVKRTFRSAGDATTATAALTRSTVTDENDPPGPGAVTVEKGVATFTARVA
jgi:hypothetical protein